MYVSMAVIDYSIAVVIKLENRIANRSNMSHKTEIIYKLNDAKQIEHVCEQLNYGIQKIIFKTVCM